MFFGRNDDAVSEVLQRKRPDTRATHLLRTSCVRLHGGRGRCNRGKGTGVPDQVFNFEAAGFAEP